MKKILNACIGMIKLMYLIIGSMIILPIAVIITIIHYIYNYAKTTIQTKIRKSNK